MITFTKFTSPAATTKAELSATLEQIMAGVLSVSAPSKAELPWIKLATFGDAATPKGSLRHDANVTAVTGVEADYDALDVAPQAAVSMLDLAGIRALVYTSPSYRPDRLKWRVLCPLSRPHAPADRKALVARLNGALGGVLAKESFVISQAYYYGRVGDNPHHAAWLVDGAPLDLVAGLAEVYPRPIPMPTVRVAGTSTDTGRDALRAACAAFATPEADGQRHQVILAATSHVAPFIKAGVLDEIEATEAIRDACTESGRPPHDGEIESAMAGAVEYAQLDPLLDWPVPESAKVAAARELLEADDGGVFVPELTEDAVALAFAERYADRFRFDHTAGGKQGEGTGLWFTFVAGQGWIQDQDGLVRDTARILVRRVRKQRAFAKDTHGAASDGFRKAVVRMSSDDRRIAMVNSQWDADPWMLGVQGGQVDLRTGEYTQADPTMFIRLRTSVVPAAPGTPTPLWSRFLLEATGGDTEFITWLQRLAGYCLTGDISEEIFAFVYGPGGAGKGTFLGSLERIMGKCAYKAPKELFQADSGINREYQIARLDRVRTVFSTETEEGRFMAESLVKEITGNEGELNARHIYGAPFTFMPRFKLIIVGNFAPKLAGRDAAMERRMRVAPFNRPPLVPDTSFKEQLVREFPGILRWMIDGCLMWQRDRLGWCDAVKAASRSYFEEQDSLTQWAGERCSIGSVHRGSATALLEDFNAWLRQRGEKPIDSRSFKQSLLSRLPGVTAYKGRDANGYDGIALRAKSTDDFAGLLA